MMIRMILSIAAAPLVLLALAPASSAEPARSLEALVAPPSGGGGTVRNVPLIHLARAMALTPALGERALPEGIVQTIEWDERAAPRNRLTIEVSRGPETTRALPKPTEAGIRAEIEAAFPGRVMSIAQPRANAFGPYGLAVAAGPNTLRCIFAWQWLDGRDRVIAERLGGQASWRAHLCRSDVTLDQMAADLDRLELGVSPQWQPARPVAARKIMRTAARVAPRKQAPAPEVLHAYNAFDGGRYLAPVETQPETSARTAKSRAFDASLPAEAYRGPGDARKGLNVVMRNSVPAPD